MRLTFPCCGHPRQFRRALAALSVLREACCRPERLVSGGRPLPFTHHREPRTVDDEPRVLWTGCIQEGTGFDVGSSAGERQQYAATSMELVLSPSISLVLGFVRHSVVTCGQSLHDPV